MGAAAGEALLIAQQREKILEEMDAACRCQDFAAAAALKRQLEELEESDPLFVLQRKLSQAVKEERYKDAAVLQSEIQQVQEEQGRGLRPDQQAGLTTSSACVSHGIRVAVRSFFIPAHSTLGAASRYLFGYNVTITNESERVVQLRNRHWVITDALGQREEVRGPGVVGTQPVLLPGKSFTYESGCPLSTARGTMEGSYTCALLDEQDGLFKEMVQVKVGRFLLSTEGDVAA